MKSKSNDPPAAPGASTPGRPHDSSRQQKHPDQHLDSGSDELDRESAKLRDGSTAKYRDRPTDDGMKGDGATEPNEGSPRMPRQKPSRRTHAKREH